MWKCIKTWLYISSFFLRSASSKCLLYLLCVNHHFIKSTRAISHGLHLGIFHAFFRAISLSLCLDLYLVILVFGGVKVRSIHSDQYCVESKMIERTLLRVVSNRGWVTISCRTCNCCVGDFSSLRSGIVASISWITRYWISVGKCLWWAAVAVYTMVLPPFGPVHVVHPSATRFPILNRSARSLPSNSESIRTSLGGKSQLDAPGLRVFPSLRYLPITSCCPPYPIFRWI